MGLHLYCDWRISCHMLPFHAGNQKCKSQIANESPVASLKEISTCSFIPWGIILLKTFKIDCWVRRQFCLLSLFKSENKLNFKTRTNQTKTKRKRRRAEQSKVRCSFFLLNTCEVRIRSHTLSFIFAFSFLFTDFRLTGFRGAFMIRWHFK